MRNYRSLFCFVLIMVIDCVSFFHYSAWLHGSMRTGGDNFGYYCYLPATVIHHDLHHLRYSQYARDFYTPNHSDSTKEANITEAYLYGRIPVLKDTCGIAILESPGFFSAHLISKLAGWADDGYSPFFMFMVHLNNLLFILAGLYFLRKLLLHYYTDSVTAMVLFAIGIASNLYHFTVYLIGMSHGYLFTLYVLLMLATIRFYRNRADIWSALGVGLTAGMITLVRPNEIICLLIPFFYGLGSFEGLKERIKQLVTDKRVYLAAFCFILCGIPQLIYWKSLTGQWLYYSYGNESFHFSHSEYKAGLFGFSNGWLPYAPVMILALAGIPVMLLKQQKWLLPVVLFLPLHIYIIYCWWCFTYVNGLGSRPMIETSALLAVPMGLTFGVLGAKPLGRVLIWLLLIVLGAQQIFMTYQSSKNILTSEISSNVFYWHTLFHSSISYNNLVELDINEYQPENLNYGRTLAQKKFADSSAPEFMRYTLNSKPFSGALLVNSHPSLPVMSASLKDCRLKSGDWIKVSFNCASIPPGASLYNYAVMLAQLSRGGNIYNHQGIRIQNKLQKPPYGIWSFPTDQSGLVTFFTQIPASALPDDLFEVFGYNTGDSRVIISDVAIEVWK